MAKGHRDLEGLRLYIWEFDEPHFGMYSPGNAFALAPTAKDARTMIMAEAGKSRYVDMDGLLKELKTIRPKIISEKWVFIDPGWD